MPALYPILPEINLMPLRMSAYLPLSISVLRDMDLPPFAFTSTGMSLDAVLTKKSELTELKAHNTPFFRVNFG